MRRPFREVYAEQDAEGLARLMEYREFVYAEGALSPKQKALMSVFADLLLGHPEGAKAILKANAVLGITKDEVKELVRLATFFGGIPTFVAGAALLEE